MYGQLIWNTSVRASALNAIRNILIGRRLKDEPLEFMMQPIANRFQVMNLPLEALDHLIPLSIAYEKPGRLASAVMHQLQQSSGVLTFRHQHVEQLIAEAETAMFDLYPNLREELRVRVRPLREQWESRGPGFVVAFGRLTGIEIDSAQVSAVLLHPVLGGDGVSFPNHQVVSIEAVLANAFFELPETVRLGWLYCQIAAFGSIPNKTKSSKTLLSQLSAMAASLAAAEEIELGRFDPRSIEIALQHWRLSLPNGPDVSTILFRWWNDYVENRQSWTEAISELDEQLCDK